MNYPNLSIAVYLDAADQEAMLAMRQEGFVKGFTTNPTLMAQAGIRDYEKFAKSVLAEITDLPISFEVFSDEFTEMKAQAMKIASWGDNVFVKVPISNSKGEMSYPLIRELFAENLKLNITAVFNETQLTNLRDLIQPSDTGIISIFAGRIADTGMDPIPVMRKAVQMFADFPNVQILWASPREVLNVYQADQCGCDIITATPSVLKKLSLHNKSLDEFSVETVKMFYDDGQRAGFQI